MINYALELGQTAKPEAVMFYILAPLAVAAAIGMLTVKKAVVDTFAGRLVKLRVGARGAIRANTTAGAYEITLRAMEDPTVVEDVCGE